MNNDPEDYEPDEELSVPVEPDGIEDDEDWDDEPSSQFLK